MAPAAEDGAAAGPMELGQRALMQGDAAGAVRHLEEAIAAPEGATLDAHLLMAEALWQEAGGKGTDKALPHYEAAARMAAEAGDTSKQAMVALGYGFALSQLGKHAEARDRLGKAKLLAEADGNPEAVRFIDRLLEQAQAGAPAMDGPEAVKATWRQFAEAVSASKQAVLFLKGTLASPADETSHRGVLKLRAAGCARIETVDVCNPGADVPEGFQGISNSSHLEFPQLFVKGQELNDWLELAPERLREKLAEAGVELGDAHEEPCHGTSAFSEGLEPWEVALVELVSQDGAGNWPKLAAKLKGKGLGGPKEAAALEVEWARLAPLVKAKLENQPDMPCGHSCSTCPTRHDCQLHDAVDGKTKDIEDLC